MLRYVGTNNHSSSEITDKLLKLRSYIEHHKDCHVYIPLPIVRKHSMKAASVIKTLRKHLLNLKINVTDHNTITVKHLGVKRPHVQKKEVGRFSF